MIRWSRLLPRLAILVLLVVAAWIFRNEIIRRQLVAQVRAQSGAAAELESVRTDLPNGSVELRNLSLFDPKGKDRELAFVEKITAHAAPKDLLQRYYHFPTVDIEGIRVSVDGADGSQLVPDKLWLKLKDSLPSLVTPNDGLDWTAFLSNDPEVVAKNLLDQLDSVKLAEQLQERWPKEVEQIRQLGVALKARFENVRNYADRTKQPGDKLELVGGLLKELDGADQGVQQFLAAVNQLRGKAQLDFDSLIATSQKDQKRLKTLKAPKIDTTNITESLVGDEIRDQWNKTVAWGDWARSLMVPVELDGGEIPLYERFGLTPPKKVRGETIHFVAQDARPELLFETVNLTGSVLFGELPIFFNGTVKNIASPMELGPEPMIAQCCFSGSGIPSTAILPENANEMFVEQIPATLDPNLFANLYVTLIVDRLGGKEEDQLIFRCPFYQLPARTLGDPEKIAIRVSPGRSRIDGVVDFKGDKIDGQIRIVQESVQLTATLPERLHETALHRVLQETLNGLDAFTVEIFVSGTRQEPQYAFKSDIADKLRPQIEKLMVREWDGIRQKADVAVADEINKAIGTLNDAIQKHLDPLVQEANGQKTLLEQQIAQATGVPLDQLIKSQLSQLSPQDQQKLGQLVNSPLVQSLLKSDAKGTPDQVDQLIQKGTEKLQQKLPGALDKLFNR